MNDILAQFNDLAETLIDFFNEKVSPILITDSTIDRDVPMNHVPPNPPRLTLDYSSKITPEGKLKSAILARTEKRLIAFMASGQGGVGKTCALRGLAEDNDIKAKFLGGIFYIQLGNDSKTSDIIEGLAAIIRHTGGIQLSQNIKALEKVQDACDKASQWFYEQSCLFLVGDLWRVNGIDKKHYQ